MVDDYIIEEQKAELKALWREYDEECECIADLCESEGYPRYGSNYELRCDNLREEYEECEAYIMSRRR